MLDTNIFVSMIYFPSNQTRQLVRKLSDSHEIIICDYVIQELRLVSERKFKSRMGYLERFFMEFPFEMVYTPKLLDINEFTQMRDRNDYPILATAINENIDLFITGDRDFLVLDIDIPRIMTMTEFLEEY